MKTAFLMTVIGCALMGSASVVAQDASESEPDTAARRTRMLELAKSYSYGELPDGQSAVLRESPLFSWTNPEVNSIGGELYLWTIAGQPLATIGIWTYDDVKDSHELQSLATHLFEATSPRGANWKPTAGGLEFKKLEKAGVPAATAVRRLTQMRNLLRERFAGEVFKRDSNQIEKLRLVPQPLYRYAPLPKGVIDGAMFSLAFDTDPEILVLLEARQETDGNAWYYAFALATSRRATGFLDGESIWNSDDQYANQTFLFMMNR